MARTYLHFVIPTLSLLLLLLPANSARGATQTLIDQICRDTADYRFCNSTFINNLYTPTLGITGLTQIALTQTLIHVTDTRVFIERAKSAASNNNTRNLYAICETGYGILQDQFTDASFDFAKGDYRSVVFLLGKCDRLVKDCENVIGSTVPELNRRNSENGVLVKMSFVAGTLSVDDGSVKKSGFYYFE